jgi:hypothetical protein
MHRSDLARSRHCVKMFKRCSWVEGDVAELGVAFGQTAFMLDQHVMDAGKVLYAFDTFLGLPYDDDGSHALKCKKGEMNYGKQFFKSFNSISETSIFPVVGLVEDTLKKVKDKKFCFVWFDLDLYKPTSFAYKFFEDRVPTGGIIGFHDYKFVRCPGIQIVVDNEVDYSKFEVAYHKDSCIYLKRK